MTGTHLAATVASGAGTNFTPIGIVASIFVPICAAVTVIVWNYCRLQQQRAHAVEMVSYRKPAEDAVSNMTDLREESES
jgi:hypothetical protein